MDLNQLKKLNDAAVATFQELGQRQRYRKDTNLRRFRKALTEKYGPVDLGQLEEVFRHMENMGFGSLVIGRDDKPTRFVWKYNLKDVAKAAETGEMPTKMFGPKGKLIKKPASTNPSPSAKEDISTTTIISIRGNEVVQYRISGANADVVRKLLESLSVK